MTSSFDIQNLEDRRRRDSSIRFQGQKKIPLSIFVAEFAASRLVAIIAFTSLAFMLVCLSVFSASAHAASASVSAQTRATIIVSGGAAISPFTTPTASCKLRPGYAAGSTDNFMRTHLLGKGRRVFTSPAMIGLGKVTDQGAAGGPFGKCPKALPAYMTVNSVGDIQIAGVHLANFAHYLQRRFGIKQVDFVAHSMGGLYSRSAIQFLRDTGSSLKVRSLTTLGTPWAGAAFANPKNPNDPNSACDGFIICEELLTVFGAHGPIVMVEQRFDQMTALNKANAGALKGIPVTLIVGDAFVKAGGDTNVWPSDGITTPLSGLAVALPDSVINHRRCHLLPGGTHSIYISKQAGLAEDTAITWNNKVGGWVNDAIVNAGKALKQPNRQGCPTG